MPWNTLALHWETNTVRKFLQISGECKFSLNCSGVSLQPAGGTFTQTALRSSRQTALDSWLQAHGTLDLRRARSSRCSAVAWPMLSPRASRNRRKQRLGRGRDTLSESQKGGRPIKKTSGVPGRDPGGAKFNAPESTRDSTEKIRRIYRAIRSTRKHQRANRRRGCGSTLWAAQEPRGRGVAGFPAQGIRQGNV